MSAVPTTPAKPMRSLGRFQLRQLLGKSDRTMAWGVFDPQAGQEMVLVLPRVQPADAAAMARWMQSARKGARLDHPHLARAVEVGEQEHWPYIAYERAGGRTLAERLTSEPDAPADIARWLVQGLEGLAFAHQAGLSHRDLQTHSLLLTEAGQIRVLGLEVASDVADGGDPADKSAVAGGAMDAQGLRSQRLSAERDVLALGLVLHHLLATQPALDEADISRAIHRLPPLGRDLVRLPWSIPRPVPDALRAIVNRATDRQERQRYRNARTLARALEGWLEADAAQAGNTHALLLERVRQIGVLPALPGGAGRAARLASLERERTIELAEIVMKDFALAFELLRMVNTAQVRGSQITGNGAVLTLRRAIAMVGIEGVRRAAQSLRPWPGPLNDQHAHALWEMIDRIKQAARVAQALRPAGYDGEVVYLVTLMQNLGRLVVQYHFPDEAAQIRRLMLPGEADEPGLSEEHAAFAVLGVDIEGMGTAVVRQWGLDEAVQHMIRRLPVQTPVRLSDSDDDVLRAVASLANEAVDALGLPTRQVTAALDKVALRYARALNITGRDLHAAMQGTPSTATEVAPDELPTPPSPATRSAA